MNTCEMNDAQVSGLAAAICATAEAMGQEMSPGTAAMMAEDLFAYPVPVVRAALKACRMEVKGKLAMADILSRVQAVDGRPEKDEAWSLALVASDERESVVLTNEIQLALTVARPALNRGDKFGARLAFISAYERFVAIAREQKAPANWTLSIGFDASRREVAINAAVQMQRIPQEHGQALLADLRVEPISENGRAIAGLLTGAVTRPSSAIRERLKAVKDAMVELSQASAERRQQVRADAEMAFAARRALLSEQATKAQEDRGFHA